MPLANITRHKALLVLLGLFWGLGLLYNVSLPLFEAPDEMAHFRYVHWLADERRLPDMVADYPAIGHEIWQPPLYYALMAPLVAGIDRRDLESVAPPNPYWREGAGVNVNYHTAAERFPYRNTTLAVRLARFGSTLLASLVIVSAYGLARFVAPRYAVAAAGFVAFNPQFLFIGAAVNNDNAIAAFSSLALLLLIFLLARPSSALWFYLLLGVVWGLAALSKVSGLALGAVIAPALCLAAWRSRSWRPLIPGLPLVLLALTLTGGWWYLRNWLLYGDPLAWEIMLMATRDLLRPELLSWPDTMAYAAFLRRSYWAMLAYGLPAPELFYGTIYALLIGAGIGLGIWLAQRKNDFTQTPFLAVLLLASWQIVIFLSLLRWMRQVMDTDQGRLLFPAAAALAVLLAVGLGALGQSLPWLRDRRIRLDQVGVAALAMWAAALSFLVIQPAFAQPRALPPQAVIPNPMAIYFGDAMRLSGYELLTDATRPGEPAEIALYWEGIEAMAESYVVAVHLVDSAGRVAAGSDSIPYQGRYATVVWPAGHLFRDQIKLPALNMDAAPGLATIWLTVYPWGRPDEALPVRINGKIMGHGLALTHVKIEPLQPLVYAPPYRSDAEFGHLARLIGYDAPRQHTAGEPLPLTLYWQAAAPDGHDYAVFVHLLDPAGELAAQADGPPQQGRYPTSIWAAGEQIEDKRVLLTPGDAAPGLYRLVVGMYEWESGRRLPAFSDTGEPLTNDALILHEVEIGP